MTQGFIVREIVIVPIKGELPDVAYQYISNKSDIGWHYDITKNVEEAHIFCEHDLDKAKEIAEVWGMKVVEVN